MIVCIKGEDDSDATPPQTISNSITNNSLAEILVPKESPGSVNIAKNVVIVMDALREFSREPLQWALDHVIQSGYTITLLGVMPYLPLPVSCKTWLDVWTFDMGNLSALKGRSELKYQKLQGIIDLCEQKGVVPCMKVAMGHPVKLVVLEQTTNLQAAVVVLDRHMRKNKAFFAERLPSSVVMMNPNGGVDMLRIQSAIDSSDSTPRLSSATLLPTPQVLISEELSEILRGKIQE